MTAISLIELANNAVPLFRTKREDGRAPTIVAEGPPGCGKSSIFKAIIRQKLASYFGCEVSVISEILGHRDPMDLKGVLLPYKTADGKPAAGYTIGDLPIRIQNAPGFKDGIVVLLLDELWQSDQLMQKVAAEPLLDGKFGEWQAPPNVWIIAATNRQQDGAGVSRVLSHVGNRVVIYDVFMPIGMWTKYGAEIGLPQVVLSFAEFVKGDFAQEIPREGKKFLTPRSLTTAAHYIKDDNEARGNQNQMTFNTESLFLRATIEGCIGEAATTKLYGFAKHAAELPTIKEIVADPLGAKVPPTSQIGAQYAVTGLLAAESTANTIEPCWTYATRLMREFQATLIKTLTDKPHGGVLLNCPGIGKWMSDPENKALLISTWEK